MKLALEEQPLPDDQIINEYEGLTLLVHPRDQIYLNDVKLDFITDVLGNRKFIMLRV